VGYFKRKIDRDRIRRLVRERIEDAADARPWEAIPARPPKTPCFIRFASHRQHPDSHCRQGVFAVTYEVLDAPDLDRHLVDGLRRLLSWFEAHLPIPDIDEPRAIFFFKSESRACMQRVWELLMLLREAGILVDMQTVERPGKIVHEDDYQIAVVPWADAKPL
jgi:hypothetical protein